MNMVSVKINGIEYNLKGEENEEYLHKVALNVDKRVKHILQNNGMLSTTSASILAAINMMDELFKSQRENEESRKKIKEYESNEKEYNQKINELLNEVKSLKQMNEKLQTKIGEDNTGALEEKESQISKLNEQLEILAEEGKVLKTENKELELQLEASKYKVLDLQNKILLDKKADRSNFKKSSNYPKRNIR